MSFAACSPSRTDPPTARVDELFAEWNRTDSPGCSVGVSRNGAAVYERGYGMANLELGIPTTPASVLGAASISKQFTAMSVLLLAERGQLSLDDEVRQHIPEWADRERRPTIRHLLNHTSGLREGFALLGWAIPSDGSVDTNEAMVPMLARQRGLNFAPGSEFQYNNGGYNLLGSVVKRVSGQSLRAFADANIFTPLGMTSTHFRDNPAMILPNRASGYSRDMNGLHQASEAVGVVGNAGLYTTVPDLLRWEQNFADVRVGTPALVAAMQTPAVLTSGATSQYGFGLRNRTVSVACERSNMVEAIVASPRSLSAIPTMGSRSRSCATSIPSRWAPGTARSGYLSFGCSCRSDCRKRSRRDLACRCPTTSLQVRQACIAIYQAMGWHDYPFATVRSRCTPSTATTRTSNSRR